MLSDPGMAKSKVSRYALKSTAQVEVMQTMLELFRDRDTKCILLTKVCHYELGYRSGLCLLPMMSPKVLLPKVAWAI